MSKMDRYRSRTNKIPKIIINAARVLCHIWSLLYSMGWKGCLRPSKVPQPCRDTQGYVLDHSKTTKLEPLFAPDENPSGSS